MPGRYPDEEDEKRPSASRNDSAVIDLEEYRRTGKIVDLDAQKRMKSARRDDSGARNQPVE